MSRSLTNYKIDDSPTTLSSKKSAVIIVTYKSIPDLDRLILCLKYVDYIFISDNGSNSEIIQKLKIFKSKNSARIFLLLNKKNYGLSKPLNYAVKYLEKHGVYWFYIFDQDAIVDNEYYSEAVSVWNQCENDHRKVGMVVPIVGNQVNLLGQKLNLKNYVSNIASAITSGIFTNIDILRAVGGFDESFFVYGADIDFTLRVRKAGYKICRINRIYIVQSYGVSVVDNRMKSRIFFKLNNINSVLNIRLNAINSYQTISYLYNNESLNSQIDTSRRINRKYGRYIAELYRLIQKFLSPVLRGGM